LPEECVDDAVSDAPQGDLGHVVVPALLLVAEPDSVFPELHSLVGDARPGLVGASPAKAASRGRCLMGRLGAKVFAVRGDRRRRRGEQVGVLPEAYLGLLQGELNPELAFRLEAGPIQTLLQPARLAVGGAGVPRRRAQHFGEVAQDAVRHPEVDLAENGGVEKVMP